MISACFLRGIEAQVGKVFPSERVVTKDAVTGNEMIVLTNGKQSDTKIYQTHPQWTSDGKWIIFRCYKRSPGSQAYAVNEQSGAIVQLTEGEGNVTASLNIARKAMTAYFLRNANAHEKGSATAPTTEPTTQAEDANAEFQVIRLDVGRLLDDAMAGKPAEASTYERICATLPRGMRVSGGSALDANEQILYVACRGGDVGQHLPPGDKVWVKPEGMRMGTGPVGLRKIDLKTGKMDVIMDSPFQVGHIQANPWVSGETLYCHETGGEAPQRMWMVMADGNGNRPLFPEESLDWVTHETIVTRDEVMFNLLGHEKKRRVRPTGICVINLRTNVVELLGQVNEQKPIVAGAATQPSSDSYGGFWHCNGSADGRWAVGDTFDGNLWLIDRRDGRKSLLSTDHKMTPDHLHATFSDDGKRILVQSGHFTNGKRLQLVVFPLPD